MLWFKFGFSVTARRGREGLGTRGEGSLSPPAFPFPDQERAVSLDLIFVTSLLSESRAWFRKQQTLAKFEWGKGKGGVFVLWIIHLKEVSQKFFPWLKWGNMRIRPSHPPPLSLSFTLPVCLRFRFLFPCTPLVKDPTTATSMKTSLKIDFASFHLFSRLSPEAQLLMNMNEFGLELKRRERTRVQRAMVEFIALPCRSQVNLKFGHFTSYSCRDDK